MTWRPIEEAWRYGHQPLIVTDGAQVFGGGWWHSREEAWLDCGGITPTHFQPLPAPPGSVDGMVMVPRVPTEEMLTAMVREGDPVLWNTIKGESGAWRRDQEMKGALRVYDALLSAAPAFGMKGVEP